jgi:hypothetical protein
VLAAAGRGRRGGRPSEGAGRSGSGLRARDAARAPRTSSVLKPFAHGARRSSAVRDAPPWAGSSSSLSIQGRNWTLRPCRAMYLRFVLDRARRLSEYAPCLHTGQFLPADLREPIAVARVARRTEDGGTYDRIALTSDGKPRVSAFRAAGRGRSGRAARYCFELTHDRPACRRRRLRQRWGEGGGGAGARQRVLVRGYPRISSSPR